jgi:hypothetical protein
MTKMSLIDKWSNSLPKMDLSSQRSKGIELPKGNQDGVIAFAKELLLVGDSIPLIDDNNFVRMLPYLLLSVDEDVPPYVASGIIRRVEKLLHDRNDFLMLAIGIPAIKPELLSLLSTVIEHGWAMDSERADRLNQLFASSLS